MDKASFIDLLLTHIEFPSAPNVIFWLLHKKKMFPWLEGHIVHANLVQRSSNLLFLAWANWLYTRNRQVLCHVFYFLLKCCIIVHSDSRLIPVLFPCLWLNENGTRCFFVFNFRDYQLLELSRVWIAFYELHIQYILKIPLLPQEIPQTPPGPTVLLQLWGSQRHQSTSS